MRDIALMSTYFNCFSETVDIDNDRALGYQANNGSTSNSSLSSG